MKLDDKLPDPDMVGASEYRAIHELIHACIGSREDGGEETPVEIALTTLIEVEGWIADIRRRLQPKAPGTLVVVYDHADETSTPRVFTPPELVGWKFDAIDKSEEYDGRTLPSGPVEIDQLEGFRHPKYPGYIELP